MFVNDRPSGVCERESFHSIVGGSFRFEDGASARPSNGWEDRIQEAMAISSVEESGAEFNLHSIEVISA